MRMDRTVCLGNANRSSAIRAIFFNFHWCFKLDRCTCGCNFYWSSKMGVRSKVLYSGTNITKDCFKKNITKNHLPRGFFSLGWLPSAKWANISVCCSRYFNRPFPFLFCDQNHDENAIYTKECVSDAHMMQINCRRAFIFRGVSQKGETHHVSINGSILGL